MNLTEDGFRKMLDDANGRILEMFRGLQDDLKEQSRIVHGLTVEVEAKELSALLTDQAKRIEAIAEKSMAPMQDALKSRARALRFTSEHLAPGKTYRLDSHLVAALVGDPHLGGLGAGVVGMPCY